MKRDQPPPILLRQPLPETGGGVTVPTREAEDEAAFYAPPSRSTMPRQSMLIVMLAAVALSLMGIGAAAYLTLLRDPIATAGGGGAGASSASGNGQRLNIPDLPPPPPVEEVVYLDIPREAARRINEGVPFVPGPLPPASPYRLTLPPLQQARAVDCLAAAQWYEAGDDWLGQRSVAQVVINRARHPSFPNSICGVVFQGMERRTGCQFSFTCDGSMARRTPSPAAWQRATAAATAALAGVTFPEVGWATHYHTDWVVPNWSRSVDKIARVRTHLFFRWRGANGRSVAFYRAHAGSEPEIPLMRPLSPAHAGTFELPSPVETPAAATDAPPATAPVSIATDLRGNALADANSETGLYVIEIKPDAFSGSLALLALDICKERRGACTVVGFAGRPGRVTGGDGGRVRWSEKTPDFYYFSDKSRARELVYWNCGTFPRPSPAQCLPPNFQPSG